MTGEPSGTIERFDALAVRILELSEALPRLVAVDGCGGAGKSTFAARLARALGDAPVVPTDDFASWGEPLEWWPRMLDQVIEPLAHHHPARYQRYDWATQRLAEWVKVPLAPAVVIEGVSSSRREWAHHMAFTIWIETPRDICLSRGLARDGEAALPLWEQWMASEDAYVDRDRPRERADVVVDGGPRLVQLPDTEFVRLNDRPS